MVAGVYDELPARGRGPGASINALIGEPIVAGRELFDEYLGLQSSDMTPDEILRHRPRVPEPLAAELPRPTFVKVHETYVHADTGHMDTSAALSPKAATAGVVYLVRNPLDMVVSYAHHRTQFIDRSAAWMNSSTAAESQPAAGIHIQLPQSLLSRSGHVSSWLGQTELPVLAQRYEDMLADPRSAFGAIGCFAGLEWDEVRLARAIEDRAFERLRAQEEELGFRERQPTVQSFFQALARDPNAAVSFTKSPSFLLCPGEFARHFKNANFLLMMRNPYAVCEGIYRYRRNQPAAPGRDMLEAAAKHAAS